jgi:hypothetical protein
LRLPVCAPVEGAKTERATINRATQNNVMVPDEQYSKTCQIINSSYKSLAYGNVERGAHGRIWAVPHFDFTGDRRLTLHLRPTSRGVPNRPSRCHILLFKVRIDGLWLVYKRCGGFQGTSIAFANPTDIVQSNFVRGISVGAQLTHTSSRIAYLHPVLVYQAAALLHASFRSHLAMTPLRFANPSPPSDWIEDSRLQGVGHARHTRDGPSRHIGTHVLAPAVSATDKTTLIERDAT